MMGSDTLKQAANDYFKRGWLPIPLSLDSNNLPKRPLDQGWSTLERTPETIRNLSWNRAVGIGIVLGPVSNNLAIIDVDDVQLGDAIVRLFQSKEAKTRLVKTARGRLHIYVVEEQPTDSHSWECRWFNAKLTGEIKGRGTQVAAPPSPGYSVISNTPPMTVPTAYDAMGSIMRHMKIEWWLKGQGPDKEHPKAWAPKVPEGNRNNTAYFEAHKLREAGIPIDQAKALMRASIRERYDPGGLNDYEIERTIESAYRKGVPANRWYGGIPVER